MNVQHKTLGLIFWLLLSFSAAWGSVFVTQGEWYADLTKPTWNPPSWVFGPVWTTLYAMMGVAAWLVWLRGGWQQQTWPLALFVSQWFLNAIWTPLFFGWHQLGWAAVEIGLLWLSILGTTVLFFRVRTLAGLLLVPYLLWVSFAALLNFTLWQMN